MGEGGTGAKSKKSEARASSGTLPSFSHARPSLPDALVACFRDYIVRQGEVGDAFYIILEGMCTVHHDLMGVINQLYATDSFGEVALLEVFAVPHASMHRPSRKFPLLFAAALHHIGCAGC